MPEWKKVNYIKTSDAGPYTDHKWAYELILPTPLADWDVYDYWEKERVYSMSKLLDQSDVLYDVGAEHGWMSVVFAKFCRVFLIEPTKEFWPNIKETWVRNCSTSPAGTFHGLVGEKSDLTEEVNYKQWPDASGGELIDRNKYQYLHEHEEQIRTSTIDEIAEKSGVYPTALSIDVEGAELLVLKGAVKTLTERNMKVWVSIHPDLGEKYGASSVPKFMSDLGYKAELLGIDHEEHWLFTK